jgi:hypothetical protein
MNQQPTNQRHLSVRLLMALTAALLVTTFAVGPAGAKGGDIRKAGNCSGQTDWKLKLGPRGGVIETEFEVDSNHNGQVWAVTITDNGVTVFSGHRTTVAPSGSFSVERRIANRAGADNIRATASRAGERCVATARV